MSIGEFTTSLRMSVAANLLCTTDLRIAEIAQKVATYIRATLLKSFHKTFECLLQYRNNSKK